VSSISDKVIGFFSLPNPSSLITALGSTQPLREVNTQNLSGLVESGKGYNPTDKCNPTA
jgi:hypothetical protein